MHHLSTFLVPDSTAVGFPISVTGFGHRPALLLGQWGGRSVAGIEQSGRLDIIRGFGVATSAVAQVCVGALCPDAAAPTGNASELHTDFVCIPLGRGKLEVASFDADGVTFRVAEPFTDQLLVHLLSLSSDRVLDSNMVVGVEPTGPGQPGQIDVPLTFTPNAAIVVGALREVGNTGTARAGTSVGFASGDATTAPQVAVVNHSSAAAGASDTRRWSRRGYAYAAFSTTANDLDLVSRAAIEFGVNELTLDFDLQDDDVARELAIISLQSNLLTAGVASAGVQPRIGGESLSPAIPRAVAFISAGALESELDSGVVADSGIYGVSSDQSPPGVPQNSHGWYSEDDATPQECGVLIDHNSAVARMETPTAPLGQLEVQDDHSIEGIQVGISETFSEPIFYGYLVAGEPIASPHPGRVAVIPDEDVSPAGVVRTYRLDPNATLDYWLDWSARATEEDGAPDEIVSSVWTAEAAVSIAASPPDAVVGLRTVVWLTMVTAGGRAKVSNTVTFKSGRVDERSILLLGRDL